jgi:hypothetical protein
MSEMNPPRHIGRSIGALFAGFLVGAGLSLGTDEILHVAAVFPPWGQPMSDALFLLATVYRILYSVAGSYVIARLAPDRPMWHALVGGAVGFALSIVGAAATWNRGLGPHWYAIAVAAIAMPCAWVGGTLRLMQLRARSAL